MRMLAHDNAISKIEEPFYFNKKITGKKRTYSEAMGKDNDYEVVQEPFNYNFNRGNNWIDAFLEQKK